MRSLIFLISVLTGGQALAADHTIVNCGACRDVYEFPHDYGNHAFNLVFSATAVLSLEQGDTMQVVGPVGQWAMVDLNFEVVQTGFTVLIPNASYQFSIPTSRVNIFVQDPRGYSIDYTVLAGTPPLLVGDGTLSQTQTETSAATIEPEPEPEPSTSTTSSTSKAGGGEDFIDWGQEGAYYWYQDQPELNLRITVGGSM